ncbi:Early nodulin-like protein 1 [Rhynchospora pubera]|uniref:Early nodulin-like protein 1 n=1 Tax=Rhynchospora pubera TaxID=906938 RepID=A0AAV8HDS5_9POAL|nr:Early nodulin-like protein 1 [Rhynchospora pubera]
MDFLASFFVSLFFLILSLCLTTAQAKEFLVGGKVNAWAVPASSSDTLNKWAEASRFQVGDSLVWNFDPEKDSVLRVTREAYLACNTTNPVASYKNGSTVMTLNHSGAYYFISGISDNCQKGEKVIVVVMSERHSFRKHLAPAPAPESGADFRAPAFAPTAGAQDRVVVSRGMLSLVLGLGLVALRF